MRSDSGKARFFLVLICTILMLFLGLTTYVVFQDNGIYDREIKPIMENYTNENTVTENTVVEQ